MYQVRPPCAGIRRRSRASFPSERSRPIHRGASLQVGINMPLERVWSVRGTRLPRKLWVVRAEATDKRLKYLALCTRYVRAYVPVMTLTRFERFSAFRPENNGPPAFV